MTLSKKAMTGLEHCINGEDCTGCIYRDECMESYDVKPMLTDVRCYIKQLESNQHKWRSPKAEPPDVDTFYAVTKFDPEIRIYKKNLIDHHYTTEWLNIRNDILYWMPIPEVPKEV